MPRSAGARDLNRRFFLQTTGAVGATIALRHPVLAADEVDAAKIVPGKDKQLVVHNSGIAVLETPAALLSEQITPASHLFVRNNQQPAGSSTLKPAPLRGTIAFSGLIDRPAQFDIAAVPEMQQVEHEMVLQCCGNGRALFAQSVKAKGTQWSRGGMGNVRFAGVPLHAVIDKLGIRIDPQARFLTAEGTDPALPGKDDFEHSLPLDETLQHSFLAWRMNGEPLPAVHGGPVRLVTPGFFGTMHVKWLSHLRFEAAESSNHNHAGRYRAPKQVIAPGTAFKYSLENSNACWRMKLKSVVLSPEPGTRIEAGKAVQVRGVAFNDGSAKIETVLLSTNRGATWRRTRVIAPDSPYGWYRWHANVRLSAGKHEIWARAIDAAGRSQPLDGSVAWNPSGYEWNGVERIAVVAG